MLLKVKSVLRNIFSQHSVEFLSYVSLCQLSCFCKTRLLELEESYGTISLYYYVALMFEMKLSSFLNIFRDLVSFQIQM